MLDGLHGRNNMQIEDKPEFKTCGKTPFECMRNCMHNQNAKKHKDCPYKKTKQEKKNEKRKKN